MSFFFVVIFFFWFLWFLYPLFMFLGGAAERAGIFKDDFIIKVFSVRLGLIFFFMFEKMQAPYFSVMSCK